MKNKVSNLASLKIRRKELRAGGTPQEVILWSRLRNNQLGFKFRRQHSFGYYIADFYCPDGRLVIEVDGSQHLENEEYDRERGLFFKSRGLRVLRFWNNEINTNIEGVVLKIEESLRAPPPPSLPL